jgi:Peptidase family M28
VARANPISDPGRFSGPIILALLILLGAMVIKAGGPPAAAGAKAPAPEFSAGRAIAIVREIAQRPHPAGSPGNARVREYLIGRFGALGIHAEVLTATVARTNRRGPRAFAIVHDIVARIPGTRSTGALMLVAHYDSVPNGPGAADDGLSVAAILEAMRALRTGPALRNDLIVLLTDGEELGMLGAKAFVENYAQLADVKVVLNFEMRGNRGASQMFQTSPGNDWLISQFASAAPHPRATSLASAIYRRLPNDTDFTIFLGAGKAGLNFAGIGGLPSYHTRLDSAERVSRRTLQHQGSYVLSLARRFGDADLANPRGLDDSVYFTIGGDIVDYQRAAALPLAIAALLLAVGVFTAGMRAGRFTVEGTAAGMAIYAGAIAISIAEATGVWLLMRWLAGDRMLPMGTTYGGEYFAAAVFAALAATLWALYSWLARWVSRQNLAAGALLMLALAAVVVADALPGGSYLLTWPVLFAAIGLHFRWTDLLAGDPLGPALAAFVALVPATLLLVPNAISGDGTLIFMLLQAALVVILAGVFVPYLDMLTGNHRWVAPLTLAAIAIVLIAAGDSASNFGAAQPRPDSICYLLDADTSRATFDSFDPRPDHWTSQFFQSHVRLGSLAQLSGMVDSLAAAAKLTPGELRNSFVWRGHHLTITGDAPRVALEPPQLQVLDDSTSGDVRTVSVHITSARSAPVVWMTVPIGTRVLDGAVDGKSAGGGPGNGWEAWFWGVPASGFDLTLKLAAGGPVRLTVIDQTRGLPAFAGLAIAPRPSDVMPSPVVFFDDSTLVRKTFTIGAAPAPSRPGPAPS